MGFTSSLGTIELRNKELQTGSQEVLRVEHFVRFGLYLGFPDTKENKKHHRPYPLISLSLSLLGSISHLSALPPSLPSPLYILFSPTSSPPSKSRLLHLLATIPAGHIFSVSLCFLLWYQRASAVKRLILLTTSDRPAMCGRREGIFKGISAALREG